MIRLQRIHFVGIGGSGMSGIAEILISLGYAVSGSDIAESPTVARLRALGASIRVGHAGANLGEADAVVVSSAIGADNPEIRTAKQRGLPLVPRAEMLAELMRLKYGIAIGGTHGKTTTTSMTAMVVSAGGLDPTVIIGGRLEQLGSGARLGKGDYLVAEADESDGSFLKLSPTVAVVTNIDDDHLDYYGDMGRLTATFSEFAGKVPFYGFSVLCMDDPRVRGITAMMSRKTVTYGLHPEAEVRAESIALTEEGGRYDLVRSGKSLGRVSLRTHGIHNVSNSLAAAAVGLELGIKPEKVIEGLGHFHGVDRRLQMKGEGVRDGKRFRVIDDYGHHPTEIAATLAAVRRLAYGRVVVVFQPHRYSRTALLYDKLAMALAAADRIWILPIYPAGEAPRPGVGSELICDALLQKGHASFDMLKGADELERILDDLEDEDLILTLGAGNVVSLGEKMLERVK